MKIIKWLNLWLENKKRDIKLKTYWSYRNCINNYIKPYLEDISINNSINYYLNEFINKITKERDLSRSTLYMIIAIIKKAVKDYCLFFHRKENINLIINIPKQKENKKGPFNLFEQQKIEQYILTKGKTNLYGILICLYTGLRIGELLALTWNDIDFKEKEIIINKTVYEGKDYNGKYIVSFETPKSISSIRKIIITKKLLILLKEMKKNAKTNFVVESRKKRQSLRSYQNKFKRLLNKLNICYKSFHSLRHTFATRTIESKMDVKVVSETLGHSSITITLNRYVTISNEYKEKEMQKLDNYLFKKCSYNNLLGVSSS